MSKELISSSSRSKSDSLDESDDSTDDAQKLFERLKLGGDEDICETKKLPSELKCGDNESSDIRKTLVLIDFKGTLVHRFRPGGQSKDGYRPKQTADFSVGTGKFWVRQFAYQFINHLLNDPRCIVAIYTSMERRNMIDVIESFDRYCQSQEVSPIDVRGTIVGTHTALGTGCIDLFDRPYNSYDRSGKNRFDTMRNLNLIWNSTKISELDYEYDATNTLLIEADPRKSRNWMKNTLCTRPFNGTDVGKPDNTLENVLDYLNNTVFTKMQYKSKGKTDIRKILESNPFPPI